MRSERTSGPRSAFAYARIVLSILILAFFLVVFEGREARGATYVFDEQQPVVQLAVDATGHDDVTDALNASVRSLPDGGTLALAPNGVYRVEGSLDLVGRHGITVLGNNAQLRRTRQDVERPQILIEDSTSIAVRAVSVAGANPHAGEQDDAYQAEHE